MVQIRHEPYASRYQEWLERREAAKGYDFGTPPVKAAPPVLRFARPLRWYSLDRPARLAAERRLRDRLVEDILSLRDGAPQRVDPSVSKIGRTRRAASDEIRVAA